jgi:hypothetical protein
VGRSALYTNTTGASNSALGQGSLGLNSTGNNNSAFGADALNSSTTADNNTAVGSNSLVANTTGANNTAVGHVSLFSNTTGGQNVALGLQTLYYNTTASNNTAVGHVAMTYNTTGTSNVAVGADALYNNTTASNNTAVGYQAGHSNTEQTVTALGYRAGYSQTGASPGANTWIGNQAGYSTTSGGANTATGWDSMYQNTSGSYNTAYGMSALGNNTTASNNTAVGYQAGYSGTTGATNSYFGFQAGYGITTGGVNTFLGYNAGASITTGSKNTIIGAYGGNQGGLDIRTASNHIVLSDGDGNPRAYWDAAGALTTGNIVLPTAASYILLGGSNPAVNAYIQESSSSIILGSANTPRMTVDASGNLLVGGAGAQRLHIQTADGANYTSRFQNTHASTPYGINVYYSAAAPNGVSNQFISCEDSGGGRFQVYSNGGVANYQANDVNLSDRREKTNFAPSKSYLDVICAIPVQTFNYIDQNMENDPGLTLGVVAQDVQAVAPEFVMESNWGTEEDPKMRLSLYQTDLQYALMKCIQEQQDMITSLTTRIEALEGAN